VFVSCAAINYYGPFTGDYRQRLINEWLERCTEYEISVSAGFNLPEIIGNSMEIRDWNVKKLPKDEVSICNGILVTKADRFPLMIDP
jgi:dynein heavy chain